MKKILIILSIFILSFPSCDYLDIVPEDTPEIADGFKDENSAENFLYSCYYNIPNYRNFRGTLSWAVTPEFVGTANWMPLWFAYISIQRGSYSPSNPVVNYWSQCYMGIRRCYLFLDNIDTVEPLFDKETFELNKKKWKAEARFLVAYYHAILLQYYGPVVIVNELTKDLNASAEDLSSSRRPYDECVAEIEKMFEESIEDLPEFYTNDSEYGRPTKMIAKALIARMYLYAASPQFNGNKMYSNFKNKDGEQLVSQEYDINKWNTALTKIETAIKYAKDADRKLYYSAIGNDEREKAINSHRRVITEDWSNELIFGYTGNREDFGGGYSIQRQVIPKGIGGGNHQYGALGTTLYAVKLFLTKNGLPIDMDPEFDQSLMHTIPAGQSTSYLHLNLEPRFHAYVGYDRGYYPANGGVTLKLRGGEDNGMEYKDGSPNPGRDYLYGGYAVAKVLHPQATVSPTQNKTVGYPYPLIRLAELYLSYAEAYVGLHGEISGQALDYLNEVRSRAGLPTFQASYGLIGGMPTGDELMKAMRREITSEFMFEGHMSHNYKRWLIATKEWAGMENGMIGLNAEGKTAEDFYKETVLKSQPFIFEAKQYLFPIPQTAIDVNQKLVQNPGWGSGDILVEN